MRQFILILMLSMCLTMALAPQTQAQNILRPNPAIETTITHQLEAFAARDVNAAWRHASPNIQNAFQTPENFGASQRYY